MSVIPGLLELSMMDDGLLGGVTAIQPVFAGGQIVNGNKLADLALEVSRYQMRQSEDEVALTVERYYWQWISLHEKLRTIEIVESLVGSLYKDVEVAVGAGVTTRNDLLQVQLKRTAWRATACGWRTACAFPRWCWLNISVSGKMISRSISRCPPRCPPRSFTG